MDCQTPLSISEESSSGISFNNPASSFVDIISSNEMLYVEIYNSQGQIVQHENLNGTISTHLMLTTTPGIYLMKVALQDGTVAIRKLLVL
jgi:hypothetical protein